MPKSSVQPTQCAPVSQPPPNYGQPVIGWNPHLFPGVTNLASNFNEDAVTLTMAVVNLKTSSEDESAMLKTIKSSDLGQTLAPNVELPPPSYGATTLVDPNLVQYGIFGQRFDSSRQLMSAAHNDGMELSEAEIAEYTANKTDLDVIKQLAASATSESFSPVQSALWLDYVNTNIWGTMAKEDVE